MRSVTRRAHRGAGELVAAILMGTLPLIPVSVRAGQAQAMPLVLPQQSLPYLRQLNGSTGFTVVCLSQVPISATGAMAPTAVVDLSPPNGAIGAGGSFSLFMFPQDVLLVQQLNGGMPITPVATFQVPSSGSGTPTQVAQVNIVETGQAQGKTGSTGCLLVCPVPSLLLLGQLNPGLFFQVLCTSQVGARKVGPGAQTALLDIQPTQGIGDPSQSLTMLLPVDTLPAIGQLNTGTTIEVVDVTQMPVGGSGALLPVALVDVRQATPTPSPSSSTPPSPPKKNQPGSSGKNQGDDNGDGNGKDHGKGQGQSKKNDKGDD